MAYLPNTIYHVYNQAIDPHLLFPKEKNYLFFLEKVRQYICPHTTLLAYCLMPNHFHFLIKTNEYSCQIAKNHCTQEEIHQQQVLARTIGTLLSSYTKAINKQENRKGSLFRLHTKYKECYPAEFMVLDNPHPLMYADKCFAYIHNNPTKARLVEKNTDWVYSSAKDYAGLRKGTLCNQEVAKELGLI